MASILIVDDDEQIRKLLCRIVEQAGYTTQLAANGDEAIRSYTQHRSDLVVTDIVMPGKEGIETIIELKRINPDVKIIAISGGGKVNPDNYLNLAKKLGAKATLEKPIGKDELLLTIQAMLMGD